jgi:hypothetical protein
MTSKKGENKAKSGGGAKRGSKAKAALKDLQVRNAKGTAIKGGRDPASGMPSGQRIYPG